MALGGAVLFVVDAQNGFRNEFTEPAVRRLESLVDHWAGPQLPFVLTRYHNYPGSQFERLLDWTSVRERPETDLIDEVAGYADRAAAVIDKTGYSALTPEAVSLVERAGWTDLYFCGFDTDTCVLKSAADAFERHYTPWLVRDCSASHGGRGHHRTGVTMIGRFIGQRQLVTHRDIAAAIAAR